jgi:molybdopterin converting factor small subunit
MEITVEFRGMLRSLVGWKNESKIEAPDPCTCAEALGLAGIDWDGAPQFGFAVVDGKKAEKDRLLKPGDRMKVFPKSFGG